MKKTILLRGATIVLPNRQLKSDILVSGGRISAIGKDLPASEDACVADFSKCIITPGFADVHVHFREPGFSYKETILTGSMAAARGGYTTVCTMPNLNPVPDCPAAMELQKRIIARDAVVEVLPYASITAGRKGIDLVDMAALKDSCVAFSDDGSGVQDSEVMLRAMREAAALDCIIAAHCEDNTLGESPESEWKQIERDIELCALTGCRYHVCHISTARSVELIRAAKSRGLRISCETAPHYLTLCRENDWVDEGRFRMNPPVRSAADRDALISGLADGTIDAIATDHAPHSAEEKSRGFSDSLMGIIGLETAFPVLYTNLVRTGRVGLDRLVDALTYGPRQAFRIPGGLIEEGAPADLTVIDITKEYTIDSNGFLSKGRSTPFEGMKVHGRVLLTLKDGTPVWTAPEWKSAFSE